MSTRKVNQGSDIDKVRDPATKERIEKGAGGVDFITEYDPEASETKGPSYGGIPNTITGLKEGRERLKSGRGEE